MAKKLSIRDRVKTYEDACVVNKEEPLNEEALLNLGITAKQIAGLKLESISRALNEGKPIDIYNGNARHYPYFWINGSPATFAFDGSFCDNSGARAGSGSRFALHERVNADYSGTQFIELWKEYLS